MVRKSWQMAVVLSVGLMISAGAWAAGGKLPEQTVQYESLTVKISAFEVRPAGAGKHPAIVLVHDKDGLTDGMKDIARSFAAAGFVVLVPDFPSRLDAQKKGGNLPMDQMTGIASRVSRLNVAKTVADVDAAYDMLAKDPSVDAAKISGVGIGWGGWRVYKMAEDKGSLYRAVIFYGVTPDDGLLGNVKAPVLAHYAQGDFYTTSSAFKTAQWLGSKFTYHIYKDTFPGFFGGGSGNVDLASAVGEAGVEEAAAALKEAERTRVVDDGPASRKLAMGRTLAFLK